MRNKGKIEKSIFKICLFLFFLVSTANTTTIRVPQDSTTIQGGINGANTGDTVLVSSGTYNENEIDYFGKDIVIISESGPDLTIIDCQSNGRGFFFHNGETNAAVLKGFTIKNGLGRYTGSQYGGGGISCYFASPTIENCYITQNSIDHQGYGGGLNLYSCTAKIINCKIYDNTISSWYGAGIHCDGGSPLIEYCEIYDNTMEGSSGGGGCGISFNNTNAILKNSLVYGNNQGGDGDGGGVSCRGSNVPEFINTTIALNTAGGDGGGIFSEASGSVIVRNSIIWGNTANNAVYNNIYAPNSDITFSDIEGTWPGTGNINSDPLFVNSDFGDFHLQSISPCIDAGDPNDPLDPDGSRTDMGAGVQCICVE